MGNSVIGKSARAWGCRALAAVLFWGSAAVHATVCGKGVLCKDNTPVVETPPAKPEEAKGPSAEDLFNKALSQTYFDPLRLDPLMQKAIAGGARSNAMGNMMLTPILGLVAPGLTPTGQETLAFTTNALSDGQVNVPAGGMSSGIDASNQSYGETSGIGGSDGCEPALQALGIKFANIEQRPTPANAVVPATERVMWMMQESLNVLNSRCPNTGKYAQARTEATAAFNAAKRNCEAVATSNHCTPNPH